ncbi:nuclear transport factor 2 family protein [Streptomyces filamentosus]
MTDRDDFLRWVGTELQAAERALHDGDPAPRRVLWSRREPVSLLGAWYNGVGQADVDTLFTALAGRFSDCTDYRIEVLSCDVVGDAAYTAAFEHIAAAVDGERRVYTLRATQAYRREDGAWRVVHRHGDLVQQ